MSRWAIVFSAIIVLVAVGYPVVMSAQVCDLKIHEWGTYVASAVALLTLVWLIDGQLQNAKDVSQARVMLEQHHDEIISWRKREHKPAIIHWQPASDGLHFKCTSGVALDVVAQLPDSDPVHLVDIVEKNQDFKLDQVKLSTGGEFEFHVEYTDGIGTRWRNIYRFKGRKVKLTKSEEMVETIRQD